MSINNAKGYEWCPVCNHVRPWHPSTWSCEGRDQNGVYCRRWMHQGTELQYTAFLLGGPEAVRELGPPYPWEVIL